MNDYESENEQLERALSAARVSDREAAEEAWREGRCVFNVGDPAPLEAFAREHDGGYRLIVISRGRGTPPLYLLSKREGQET